MLCSDFYVKKHRLMIIFIKKVITLPCFYAEKC